MNKKIFYSIIFVCTICAIRYYLLSKSFTDKNYLLVIKQQPVVEKNGPINNLGVIMDGNRRWAKSHGYVNENAYREGAKRLWDMVELCIEEKIPNLTAYALTLDNVIKRPKDEISALLNLAIEVFEERSDWFFQQNVKVCFIGNDTLFADDIRKKLHEFEDRTKNGNLLTIYILLGYGGLEDCVYATRQLAKGILDGSILIDNIDDTLFRKNIRSAKIPDIDLIIRTGAQERLSAFMPIQSIYSELVFMSCMWPDIKKEEVRNIVHNFSSRRRPFGA